MPGNLENPQYPPRSTIAHWRCGANLKRAPKAQVDGKWPDAKLPKKVIVFWVHEFARDKCGRLCQSKSLRLRNQKLGKQQPDRANHRRPFWGSQGFPTQKELQPLGICSPQQTNEGKVLGGKANQAWSTTPEANWNTPAYIHIYYIIHVYIIDGYSTTYIGTSILYTYSL